MGLNLEETELLRSVLADDLFDRECEYPLFLQFPLPFSSSTPVLQCTCTHINSFDTHILPYHEQIRLHINVYKLSVAGEKQVRVAAQHWVGAEGSGGSAGFCCQQRSGGRGRGDVGKGKG